jgi:hypothetical protein
LYLAIDKPPAKRENSIIQNTELIMEAKGYSYTVEDEKILEYMKLTTEQKLQWWKRLTHLLLLFCRTRRNCCARNCGLAKYKQPLSFL